MGQAYACMRTYVLITTHVCIHLHAHIRGDEHTCVQVCVCTYAHISAHHHTDSPGTMRASPGRVAVETLRPNRAGVITGHRGGIRKHAHIGAHRHTCGHTHTHAHIWGDEPTCVDGWVCTHAHACAHHHTDSPGTMRASPGREAVESLRQNRADVITGHGPGIRMHAHIPAPHHTCVHAHTCTYMG